MDLLKTAQVLIQKNTFTYVGYIIMVYKIKG